MDADEEEDSSESDLSGEENSEKEESELEESEAEDEEEEDSDGMDDGMDDEETITDKLRMRIHEALGDSAALTDTVRMTRQCPYIFFGKILNVEFKII